jgi:alpha-galactosidase
MKFIIHCLNTGRKYRIYNPENQKEVGVFTGRELTESGLLINIEKINSALVLGIEIIE